MSIVFDFHDKVVVVHAVFASIAVLGTAPAALLIARYHRGNRRWFAYHRALNIATVLLIVLAFGLGTAAAISQGLGVQFTGPYHDLHHDLGLSLFILIIFQGVLGLAAHLTGQSGPASLKPSGKTWTRWIHTVSGIVLMALLYTETWVGFDEWNTMQSTGTFTPDGVRYVFLIIMGVQAALYLYRVGCNVIAKVAGDDGRGPWKKLEGETAVPACAQC